MNVHEGLQAFFLDILFKLQKAAYVYVEEEGDSWVCPEKQRCEMHINSSDACNSIIPHRKLAIAHLTRYMQNVLGFCNASLPCSELWIKLHSNQP